LLESQSAQRWLGQFADSDRPVAEALLNAIYFVPHEDFVLGLRSALLDVSGSSPPAALFVARKLTKMELSTLPSSNYFGDRRDKKYQPNAVGPGRGVGSQGTIASLIRDLAREVEGEILDHPSIAEMTRRNIRKIIVVDDLLGSGERVRRFLGNVYEHPTVRSWLSLRYVTVHVVAFSATRQALAALKQKFPGVSVTFQLACPNFRKGPWSRPSLNRADEICQKYAPRSSFRLGFAKSRGLLVFAHSCPNNVPAIFWGTRLGGGDWQPLFPKRNIPDSLRACFRFPAAVDTHSQLSILGQVRLAENREIDSLPGLASHLVIFLAAVSRRVRGRYKLSNVTALTVQECALWRGKCLGWGFIDETGSITNSGRAELTRLRALKSSSVKGEEAKVFSASVQYYFPSSLRRP
jgi:hypothetical protein